MLENATIATYADVTAILKEGRNNKTLLGLKKYHNHNINQAKGS